MGLQLEMLAISCLRTKTHYSLLFTYVDRLIQQQRANEEALQQQQGEEDEEEEVRVLDHQTCSLTLYKCLNQIHASEYACD